MDARLRRRQLHSVEGHFDRNGLAPGFRNALPRSGCRQRHRSRLDCEHVRLGSVRHGRDLNACGGIRRPGEGRVRRLIRTCGIYSRRGDQNLLLLIYGRLRRGHLDPVQGRSRRQEHVRGDGQRRNHDDRDDDIDPNLAFPSGPGGTRRCRTCLTGAQSFAPPSPRTSSGVRGMIDAI